MTTLDDAWAWHNAVVAGARRLTQLSKHWLALPWDSAHPGIRALHNDQALGRLQPDDLTADAERTQEGLDDLTVLILFSVFEAQVRDWVVGRVRPEIDRLSDPTLKKAGEDVLELVEQGSFGRLLEPYKTSIGTDLTEQVNQVRRYRNWVAHGKRGQPPANVTPRDAFNRLTRFLAALRGGAPP